MKRPLSCIKVKIRVTVQVIIQIERDFHEYIVV